VRRGGVRKFVIPMVLLAAVSFLAGRSPCRAQGATGQDEIAVQKCLVVGRVGSYGRSAVHRDAVEAFIVAGKWSPPGPGDEVALPDGRVRRWKEIEAGKDGWFEDPALRGGYAFVRVAADRKRVMILDASGHRMVYVNGQPRAGDTYGNGIVRLPVLLRRGENQLLFHCSRGRLRAKLVAPKSPVAFDLHDNTLPDLVVGEEVKTWGAVVVANATTRTLADLHIQASWSEGTPSLTPLPAIAPLTVRKVGFRIEGPAPKEAGECKLDLKIVRRRGDGVETLDSAAAALRIRRPDQCRKRTFVSDIDGSVQYYAVQPAHPLRAAATSPALFLSLHGASVEAINQARSYESKTWGHIVAPTNRRPYGFDWEDWGRLDAIEVLRIAQFRLGTDPRRTYLTGHSMGGHGVWQLGAVFPDRFAAIGPSAGWISFWSYTGAKRFAKATPIGRILLRATTPSDTLTLSPNYAHEGVYILHGSADDNVPVGQARAMKKVLSRFHRDFVYHEQPGAGHWWDASDEPGVDCVDWAPMFDFFAHHVVPADEAVRRVRFVTASPGVSARCHWLTIEAQVHPLEPSSADIRFDPGKRRFVGATTNVARLSLDLAIMRPGEPFSVALDGREIEPIAWPKSQRKVWLLRRGDEWTTSPPPPPDLKGPHRYGPFKEAFRNRVLFVYATAGTPEENAWAFAKARYDAETFWYRGNGSVDLVADKDFDPSAEPDRNVILYGNADTNAAWPALLGDGPVRVERGSIRIGGRKLSGDDLACLFVRPRPGSDRALVGVVGGSGLAGMRLTDRLPYFVSGVAYPDCIVIGPEMLSQGLAGVRAAGFFGLDWGVESGDFAWRD